MLYWANIIFIKSLNKIGLGAVAPVVLTSQSLKKQKQGGSTGWLDKYQVKGEVQSTRLKQMLNNLKSNQD